MNSGPCVLSQPRSLASIPISPGLWLQCEGPLPGTNFLPISDFMGQLLPGQNQILIRCLNLHLPESRLYAGHIPYSPICTGLLFKEDFSRAATGGKPCSPSDRSKGKSEALKDKCWRVRCLWRACRVRRAPEQNFILSLWPNTYQFIWVKVQVFIRAQGGGKLRSCYKENREGKGVGRGKGDRHLKRKSWFRYSFNIYMLLPFPWGPATAHVLHECLVGAHELSAGWDQAAQALSEMGVASERAEPGQGGTWRIPAL